MTYPLTLAAQIDSFSAFSPERTGRKKNRRLVESSAGASPSADGQVRWRSQTFNRDADEYHEVVQDSDGTVVHEAHEKLSEHFGHGSVKRKPD